jgi:porphobilinogen synthase
MKKFRHLRADKKTRDKFAETELFAKDLILPFFVTHGKNREENIPGFGSVKRYSKDRLIKAADKALKAGIDKFLIFGVVDEMHKDALASYGTSGLGPVEPAVYEMKKFFPQALVITDVCLCGYTDHGHCGIVKKGIVDNTKTLPLLAKMAVSHATAGADMAAPSAMMDGQVAAIRKALDSAGYEKTRVMGYSAKFASAFYGPFRSAARSAPSFGDRKTYQMDYRNIKQAVDEIGADIEEGADIVMVKPAGYYLDVVSRAREKFRNAKIAAYQVSGEHMLIKNGARHGIINEKEAVVETLTSIKRAGADLIITYFAKEAAGWL